MRKTVRKFQRGNSAQGGASRPRVSIPALKHGKAAVRTEFAVEAVLVALLIPTNLDYGAVSGVPVLAATHAPFRHASVCRLEAVSLVLGAPVPAEGGSSARWRGRVFLPQIFL